MKWTYSIRHKMTAALLLLLVLGLVLMNNIRESNDSEHLQEAIMTIYDDRLVPSVYILHLSAHLHKIIDIMDNAGYTQDIKYKLVQREAAGICEMSKAYRKTKLTADEAVNLERFERLCGMIKNADGTEMSEKGRQSATDALVVLHTLSGIQLAEAQLVVTGTRRVFSLGEILSHFEMVVLLVIAVLIQGLIFSSRTLQLPVSKEHNLN